MNDTQNRLSPTTIGLHWLIAILIIGMLALGLYLDDLPKGSQKESLVQIHKAIGFIVLIFAAVRFVRRIMIGFPPHVFDAAYKSYEIAMARVVHWLLLLGSVIMPISGMVTSLVGGHDIDVFGLFTIPGLAEKHESFAEAAFIVHAVTAKILMAAIVLHIAGAFKHYLLDKDHTLQRIFARVGPST